MHCQGKGLATTIGVGRPLPSGEAMKWCALCGCLSCVVWLVACAEVAATNPHDPAAPGSVQATGRVSGRLVLPGGFGAARLEGAKILLKPGQGVALEAAPDETGAFSLSEVRAGFYMLRVDVDGLRAEPRAVELGIGEDRALGDIPLATAAEDATGFAVGVARREPSVGDEHGGIRVGARDTPLFTTTRSDGRFELALPAGRYNLEFEAAGYDAATLKDVDVVAGEETEPIEVVVRGRPGSIRGRLRVDPAFSRPGLLADATVTRATTADGESEAAATPDPDGAFVFPDVPAGRWHVRVSLPGFEPTVTRAVVRVDAATDLDFVDLVATLEVGTLHGTARLAGAPEHGHGGIRVRVQDTPFSTETAPDGAFTLPDLPVNRYALVFSRRGFGTATLADVDVTEGENEPLEVVLSAAPGAFSGFVALPAGFDAPGRLEQVELRRFAAAAPPGAEPVGPPSRAGADGFFLLGDVGVGRWRVEARLDGFRPFVEERGVGPGERVDLGRILLRPDLPSAGEAATVVSGAVRLGDVPGESGHGGVRVEVEGAPFTTVSNDAGAFQVTVLARQVETLRFHLDGYASPPPVEVRDLVRGADNPLAEPVVLDARPGEVRGRVALDRFGDEVLLRQVAVRLFRGGQGLPAGVVGPDGAFAMGNVPAGAYTLRASLTAYQEVSAEVEVGVGGVVDVGALLLRHESGTADAVPLGGRVRLAGSVDHSGTRVRVRFVDRDRPFALVVTDAAGRFQVPAAGEPYNLVFERAGYTTVNPYGPVTTEGDGFVNPDGDPIDLTMDRADFDGRVSVRFDLAPDWVGAADRVATVRLRGPAATPAPVTTTAGQPARFGGLGPGRWTVTVEREGFTADERVVALGLGAEEAQVDDAEVRLVDLAAARLDLSGLTLSAEDLEGVSIAGADLAGVTLTGDFSGADFTSANLANADLRGVDLRGARLVAARLFGTDLRGADLRGADLQLAALFAANLSPGEDDAPTRLEGADLRSADLSFAQLRGALFVSGDPPDGPPCAPPPPAPDPGEPPDGVTRLGGARFGGADLTGAVLDGLFFSGASEVPGVAAPSADLSGAQLVGASLARACLRGVELTLADLTEARLSRADVRNGAFARAVLEGVDLRGADLRGASLLSAVLHRARADCLETEAGQCACAEPLAAVDAGGPCDDAAQDFEPAGWGERCGCRTRLADAELADANLVGADFTGADLRRAGLVGITTGDIPVDPEAGVPYLESQPLDCTLPDGCAWPPGPECDLEERRACRVVPSRFAGATLDEASLAGATLTHVDLTNASLRDANASNVRLSSGSLLRGIDAARIDLTGAVLAGLDLTGLRAPGALLRRTALEGAVLVDVDLSGALLDGVTGLDRTTPRALNLAGAVVRDTALPTDGRGLDLREATVDVPGAWFPPGTRLDGATVTGLLARDLRWLALRGADLRGSVAGGLQSSDATAAHLGSVVPPPDLGFDPTLMSEALNGTLLREANLDGLHFSAGGLQNPDIVWWFGADLRDASLRGTRIDGQGGSFRGMELGGADLTEAVIRDLHLRLTDLSGGALAGARIEDSGRYGVTLHLCDLREAGLATADLHDILLSAVDLRGADLRDASWSGVTVRASDLRGAQLEGAVLSGGGLDRVEVDSLAGLSLDGADLLLVDVTGADLTDLQMQGGRLVGVNVADAAATGGVVLNPDSRDDDANRVGLGASPGWDGAPVNLARSDLRPARGLPSFAGSNLNRAVLGGGPVASDLRGATLAGADLAGATIGVREIVDTTAAGADFSQTTGLQDLRWIDLRDAVFADADLSAARIHLARLAGDSVPTLLARASRVEYVDIRRAPLAGVDLSGRTLTGLLFTGADLSDADLSGASLVSGQGADANLAGADLTGARLIRLSLWRANLSGAHLDQATIDATRLFCADLSGASLRGATLTDFYPLGCIDLTDAELADAELVSGDLWEATLTGADLSGVDLTGHSLADTELAGASLVGATLDDAVLSRANLAAADLTGASAAGLVAFDVDLHDATLADADLAGALLLGANLAGASLSGADLADADLTRADLTGADLRGADLRRTRFIGATLTDAEVCASAPEPLRERPGVVVDGGC